MKRKRGSIDLSRGLSKDQIEDLLLNVLNTPKIMPWKGSKIQFCCTVHGESHPSAGIDIDFVPEGSNSHYQVFHCFSCGASGSIPWLVMSSLPDEFDNIQQVNSFLRERYNVEFSFDFDTEDLNIKRYDEHFVNLEAKVDKRFEMPRSKLAVFKSGKETYKYFFDRGFTKKDMQEYMIGRDLESETITIPAFWEDGKLAGVIGRYIDPRRPKNMRFKIYGFPKAGLIYPLDKLEVIDDTIIGVESMFDAMLLRKWGYKNAVAMMGDGMSKQQANQIAERCSKFIDLFDHDKGGETAREIAKRRLGDRVMYLVPHYYPETGKDPSDWGEEETNAVIESAGITSHRLPRL